MDPELDSHTPVASPPPAVPAGWSYWSQPSAGRADGLPVGTVDQDFEEPFFE